MYQDDLTRSDVFGGGYEPRAVRVTDLDRGSRMYDAILKGTTTFIMRSRGSLLSFACTKADKLRMAKACTADYSDGPTLYMVWPGIYQSHLFIFDSHSAIARVIEILDDRREKLELEIKELVEKKLDLEVALAAKRMEIRNL